MEATTTIVLYRNKDREIIAEVFAGEKYYIPKTVNVFVGTLEEFKEINPDYELIKR
ncbi:hypothetical protein D3C80_1691500 [compost metagenome]